MSSLSIVDPPPIVQTAEELMAPLPIVGRGVLSTSSFHVPTISHVPQVTMELVSTSQITDHDCSSFLTLTLAAFRIFVWGF